MAYDNIAADPSADAPAAPTLTRPRLPALLCALLVGLCALIPWPFAAQGYLDDFSYARTSLEFANTGHIVYNGWTASALGWQLLWGALWIHLLGFSFNVLRLAILPIALATAYLFHRLLTRIGLPARAATLGTLTLCLSPLFLASADSFMTDVPGLFALLLIIYCCALALYSSNDRTSTLWLVTATILGIFLGTVRQTSFLGLFITLPATALALRRRPRTFITGIIATVVSVVAVMAFLHWFNHQPNIFPEPSLQPAILRQIRSSILIPMLLRMSLGTLFLLSPILTALAANLFTTNPIGCPVLAPLGRADAPLNPAANRNPILLRLAVVLVLGALAFAWHPGLRWTFPWVRMSLEAHPLETLDQPMASSVEMSPALRIVVSLVTLALAWLAGEALVRLLRRPNPTPYQHLPATYQFPSPLRALAILLGPLTLVYTILVLPRAGLGVFFDRYLLGILPALIALLLVLFHTRVRRPIPTAAFVFLAAFAAYAIGGVHDYYAQLRSSDLALSRLLASGVTRREISQSFQSDGLYQLTVAGHLHMTRGDTILDGAPSLAELNRPIDPNCSVFLEPFTPSLHPRFYILRNPNPCISSSAYPPIPYTTWLPPYNRQMYIQQRH